MKRNDVDILGVAVHGHKAQYSVARQKLALAAAEPRGIIEMGKEDVTIETVWKRATSHRVLAIEWLFLICTIRGGAKKKRDLVHRFVDEVQERGGEIWEVGSDRRTDDREEKRAMMQDAFEAVTMGRQPIMTARGGRPPRKWSPRQKEVIEAKWLSHAYATNEEAAEAVSKELGIDATPRMCWDVMKMIRMERGEVNPTGASGRPWKTKRRR
jgi:hypothetical protein